MTSAIVFYIFIIITSVNGDADVNRINGWSNPQNQYATGSICPQNSQCLPRSFCQSFDNRSPYYTDRFSAVQCGNEGSDLVCCFQSNTISNRNYHNSPRCGVSLIQDENYLKIGTFPFVVRVGFRDAGTGEMKYPCSGSIINERIVLTAAHCALAKADNFKLYTVRVGEFDTNTQLDCGYEFCALPLQDITISHVIVHPGYDQRLFKDDIALLVLNTRINFTVTAQPVCLPDTWSVVGNYATLVGWGKIAGQTENFPHQQAILLPIVNIQQCIDIYGGTLPINENHLCAGGERKRDACTGFGGSPLLEKQGGLYYQVGIMSFGSQQCGAAGVPSVYTNVKNYVSWIKQNAPIFYN